MDAHIFYKIVLFWLIFFISPGPVWIAVMETTRKLGIRDIVMFSLRIYLPANIGVQCFQVIICSIFVEFVSRVFTHIGWVFYSLGGLYILYLAYKTLKSKQSNSSFKLSFSNLAMVMLLSPKIWLLIPSGAVIANQLSDQLAMNATVFALTMLTVSNLMYIFYVILGKIGTKFLGNNFAYLSFWLLILFALFLFNEVLQLILSA